MERRQGGHSPLLPRPRNKTHSSPQLLSGMGGSPSPGITIHGEHCHRELFYGGGLARPASLESPINLMGLELKCMQAVSRLRWTLYIYGLLLLREPPQISLGLPGT